MRMMIQMNWLLIWILKMVTKLLAMLQMEKSNSHPDKTENNNSNNSDKKISYDKRNSDWKK